MLLFLGGKILNTALIIIYFTWIYMFKQRIIGHTSLVLAYEQRQFAGKKPFPVLNDPIL